MYFRPLAGRAGLPTPQLVSHLVLKRNAMKSVKLFALVVAVVGMIAVEAQAGGGRRSRGCSNGSCGTTVSSCSNGSCGTVVTTAAPAAPAKPATETKPVETKKVETVAPAVATCTAATCSTSACSTCSTGDCSNGRSRGLFGRSRRCR